MAHRIQEITLFTFISLSSRNSQGEGGEPEVEAPWGVQVNVFLATEGKLRRVVKKPDVGGGTV